MIPCFYSHPWINNHSWINNGQSWGAYTPSSFASLPLEIQMQIVRAAGPDIAKTLETMELVSREWYNIAGALWELFAKSFPTEDIERARKRLTDLGQPVTWKNIYKLLAPFNVRISFYADLPYEVTGIGEVQVTLPDGRTLHTQDFKLRERLGFYDSNNQPVPTLTLRLIDFPYTFKAAIMSEYGFDQYWRRYPPSTITIHPYVTNPVTGERKRITGIRITNEAGSLQKLIGQRSTN